MNSPSTDLLMNQMVTRLDHILPEELENIPEDKSWQFIQIYLRLDPLLAQLFKQYSEAKSRLGRLLVDRGSEDPMTEVAWDMHDSLRGAVETRLIELKEDPLIQEQAEIMIKAQKYGQPQPIYRGKSDTQSETFERMIAFMVWAGLVLKNTKPPRDVRKDFRLAC
ncbi:MAG: hypothetical protein KBC88_03040 [Alphaproteobacteria bacterium]|jgi:hypothetical protein|nr:hypothetical protein [Alphaproteobacteria bacterium]